MRIALFLAVALGCETPPHPAAPNATVVTIGNSASVSAEPRAGVSPPVPTPQPAPEDLVRIDDVSSSPAAPVEGAAGVAAGLLPEFRACYRAALREDRPTPPEKIIGIISVVASVTASGRVESVNTSKGYLTQRLEACVFNVVRRAQFTAPGGGGSLVGFSLTFGTDPNR